MATKKNDPKDAKKSKPAKGKAGDASPAKKTREKPVTRKDTVRDAKRATGDGTSFGDYVDVPKDAPETAASTTTTATEGEVMDGHTVHEALKHVLNACPKADGPDGNPALAFAMEGGA